MNHDFEFPLRDKVSSLVESIANFFERKIDNYDKEAHTCFKIKQLYDLLGLFNITNPERAR